MELHPGNVQGYTNEIQIAGSDAAIGHNPGINEAVPITSKGNKTFQWKTASPAGTIHKTEQDEWRRHVSGWPSGGTAERARLARQAGDGPRRRKNSHRGRWNSSWLSGDLVIVSLASSEQPGEKEFPQQRPRPTNFLRAKRRSFANVSDSKRQLRQWYRAGQQPCRQNYLGHARGLAGVF